MHPSHRLALPLLLAGMAGSSVATELAERSRGLAPGAKPKALKLTPEAGVAAAHTLSFGAMLGSTRLGPLRDVGLQFGQGPDSRASAWGAGPAAFVMGPRLDFDVPGQLSLGLLLYKEYNAHSLAGRGLQSEAALRLNTAWSFDLGQNTLFKGWATYTGDKGSTGFHFRSQPETWLEASLLFDLGAASGKPRQVYGGLGYQYIFNKFGNPSSGPGSKVSAPLLKIEARF